MGRDDHDGKGMATFVMHGWHAARPPQIHPKKPGRASAYHRAKTNAAFAKSKGCNRAASKAPQVTLRRINGIQPDFTG
jgi:predicted chitinase